MKLNTRKQLQQQQKCDQEAGGKREERKAKATGMASPATCRGRRALATGAPPRPKALCGRVRPAQRPELAASQRCLCDAFCASSSSPPGQDSAVAPSLSPPCLAPTRCLVLRSQRAPGIPARRLSTLHSIYVCVVSSLCPQP